MAVLPKSATLWAFSLVFIVFLLGTALLGISMRALLSRLRGALQIEHSNAHKAGEHGAIRHLLTAVFSRLCAVYRKTGLEAYVRLYVDIVAPERNYERRFTWWDVFVDGPVIRQEGYLGILVFVFYYLPVLFLRRWPRALVREALTREIFFLRDQYHLYQAMQRYHPGLWWSPLGLARDILRVLFLPVWCALIVGIIGVLVAQDIIYALMAATLSRCPCYYSCS